MTNTVQLNPRAARDRPRKPIRSVEKPRRAIGSLDEQRFDRDGLVSLVRRVVVHGKPSFGQSRPQERGRDQAINQSYPDYLDLRDRNRSFDGLAAYDLFPAGLDTGQGLSGVWVQEVTANYFDVLRIQPYLGRFFHSSDEHGPNTAPYIVLPWAYWHTHFQDDRRVVGRVVRLNRHPFTILGVGPPEFRGNLSFLSPDFWVPIANQEQVQGVNVLNARAERGILMVLGHLKQGVTPAQAIADLNAIGAQLEKSYPKTMAR